MTKEAQFEENGILKEIAELLNEGTDTKTMLSDVLKRLLYVTGLETGWIFLIDVDGNHELTADFALPPALAMNQKERMCHGKCWCVNKYNNHTLNKATNIIECKRIEDALDDGAGETCGLTHHATVPLRAGNERFGLLNVGSPNKTHFHKNELALLEAIAYQVGTALKRINLTQREQEIALVAERNRLARDLHDSVNQLLFSLSLTARAGMEMTEDEEVKQTFSYMQDLTQEALGEMRSLIWQLKPRGLENGLVSALKGYGEMLGMKVEAKVTGATSIPGNIEEAIWRIGQEAIANCKKYSGAADVFLSLHTSWNETILTIKDKGCGFYYNENLSIPSLGLKNMKARTEALNGLFRLQSQLGNGTEIKITIPL